MWAPPYTKKPSPFQPMFGSIIKCASPWCAKRTNAEYIYVKALKKSAKESTLNHVTQLTGTTPERAYCDMGYRGYGITEKTHVHLVGKIPKRATKALRKWMKRRAAVEPIIGHLKSDYRLNRNQLKGKMGDRANVVLTAAAYNMAKLLA